MYNGVLTAKYPLVKGYIRKSSVLFSMREYTKAIEAIQEVCSFLCLASFYHLFVYLQAAEHDDENKHSAEIQQQVLKCNQALMTQRAGETDQETLERAMRDPEIAVSIILKLFFQIKLNFPSQGNYERSGYAADPSTGATELWCAAGSYEEPHDTQQDYEAG